MLGGREFSERKRMKKFLTIHASDTPPDQNLDKIAIELRDRVFGFPNIGYHVVIRRDGQIEFGRPYDFPSVHDHFSVALLSYGVCLVGGRSKDGTSPEDNFTEAQREALRKVIAGHPYAETVVVTPTITRNLNKWLASKSQEKSKAAGSGSRSSPPTPPKKQSTTQSQSR